MKGTNDMKKILVDYKPSFWIAGKEDPDFWYCQHSATETEKQEVYESLTHSVTYESIEVCTDCGAVQEIDGTWIENELNLIPFKGLA